MSNSTTTIKQSIFDRYSAEMQEKLLTQGIIVINDPETPAFPKEGDMQIDLLVDEGVEEEDEDKSDLFINIYVVVGERRLKLTFASLDSDFVRFNDKEHTIRNNTRDAIVNAVDSAGIDVASEKIKFSVELSKKGEQTVIDLLAD